jgi:carbonic anhydrase/acetyltransferase-like protein (isoleucine patch superfamily)
VFAIGSRRSRSTLLEYCGGMAQKRFHPSIDLRGVKIKIFAQHFDSLLRFNGFYTHFGLKLGIELSTAYITHLLAVLNNQNSIFTTNLKVGSIITPAMPYILPVHGVLPQLGHNCYVARNATLVGRLTTGVECSFWFNSVVRADVNTIVLGDRVNVQDGACIHCTYQKHPTVIGSHVSIGHHAIVHGCTIHSHVLVGMGAIVMDGAVVHSHSIIAAGAIVTEGTVVPSGVIYAGIPAKKLKDLPPALLEGEIKRIANNYVLYSSWMQVGNGQP